jgi:hypothetical protein
MSQRLPIYGGDTHFIEHLQTIARLLSGELVDRNGRMTEAVEQTIYFTSANWGLIVKELREKYADSIPAELKGKNPSTLIIGKIKYRNARTEDQEVVDTMNALFEDKTHYMYRKERARKV